MTVKLCTKQGSFLPELKRRAAPAAHAAGTWETRLQGRDLDGNAATFEACYDTALNITWRDNNCTATAAASASAKAGVMPAMGRAMASTLQNAAKA